MARLAANLEFFSRTRVIGDLATLDAQIRARLEFDGIPGSNIVYISLDDPPSSSPAMCRLLRDECGVSTAKFVASTSGLKVNELTRRLQTGAVVYVDDFSGSGKQFVTAREDVREYISGNFSEFFLLPCICEEALEVVELEGVEAMYGKQHMKSERPLLPEGYLLDEAARSRIIEHSVGVWGFQSLGFQDLATNVVFYDAAPDTTPIMFRGDRGQDPWFGIVPRWGELSNVD